MLDVSDCDRNLSFAPGPATVSATCAIKALPNTPAGTATTDVSITPSPGNYTLGTSTTQVQVTSTGGGTTQAVPALSTTALAWMGLLLGGMGLVRRRRAA